MSKRLQVVIPEADLEQVRDAARRNRVTASTWVRRVLRDEAQLDLQGLGVAVREAAERTRSRRGVAVRSVEELVRRAGAARAREADPEDSGEREIVRSVTLEVRLWEHHLEAVCRRYKLSDWSRAVREAVFRAAFPPATREEALDPNELIDP